MKLGNIVKNITSGGTPSTHNNEYYGGDIPWLRTQEVNFNFIKDTEIKITPEGLKNSSAKWIQKDSVIVAMYGNSAGRVAYNKISLTTNQACCNITVDEKKADSLFLYYYLVKNYSNLEKLANGGAQQNLNVGIIKDFPFPNTPLPEQKRIANILSSFDNKIEQLKKENNILEDIAQNIFKEWFVKYNFPNKDGKPYRDNKGKMRDSELGLIPEGWRVTTYGEMGDLKNGINYSRDENGDTICKIINTRDIVETNYITDQNLERINIDKEKAQNYLVTENDILIVRSASPGKVAVVQNPSGMVIYSGFIIRLSPEDINTKWYMYEDLKENGPKLTKYSEGSVMKNINQQIINKTPLVFPPGDILERYTKTVKNLHQKIWDNNIKEIDLNKLKILLLNKLIM